MTWQGKKVLVTGAGGFIGSHLAETLVRKGAEVRAMIHYNGAGLWGWLDDSELAGDMEIYAGDIADPESVRRAIEDVDTAFHLAALIAIPYSYHAPRSYLRTNVEGTMNVLQAARDFATRRVVHTSTSEVYGTARRVPIDEEHPLQGQSPYSASKIAADKIAESFHCAFEVPVVTVRPFNTFGPRQSARAVIPTIISQALDGKVVKLGSTTPTRDLTLVSDTVTGFLKAGEAVGCEGRTVNLGTGREISIGDLRDLIGNLMGLELSSETESQRVRPPASEVERLLSDNSLAKELLDWEPETSLEDGLKQTIAWIKENQDRFRQGVYAI